MVPQKSYKRSPNLGAQTIAYRVAHTVSQCFILLGMGVIMVVEPEQKHLGNTTCVHMTLRPDIMQS